ncbi:UNVERIFIED_CONTAM: deoxycytidyl transferase [Gekko kuhli]
MQSSQCQQNLELIPGTALGQRQSLSLLYNAFILSSIKHQSCIMHVDMDCFFVSVGIREKPDLKGKPVAVTSNRGSGKALLRPGANPQLEWQYYQNKLLKSKTETSKLDLSTEDKLESPQVNGNEFDISVSSMAEIASCSYEARQAGIKNGMFFGQAKRLCPDLQAVPYDFQAYKTVAQTMYEILASYTHNIEAVSCDEALVDITEILAETGLSPEEIANAIRTEIKNKTKCSASTGIGSNILLARMATRSAKPDGQYHLKPEEVDDFIRSQLVIHLPGVGRTMDSKLLALGIKTCGDLQCITMSKLQQEFGPKTGQMLFRFCRGLDDRPVQREKERKSVSAEINYGIRFTQLYCCGGSVNVNLSQVHGRISDPHSCAVYQTDHVTPGQRKASSPLKSQGSALVDSQPPIHILDDKKDFLHNRSPASRSRYDRRGIKYYRSASHS